MIGITYSCQGYNQSIQPATLEKGVNLKIAQKKKEIEAVAMQGLKYQ